MEELGETDIADYALEALKESGVKEVYLLGRRGPLQAAFTNPEVRELGNLEDAHALTKVEEVTLDVHSAKHLEEKDDTSARKKHEILSSFSEEREPDKSKKLHLRFLVSPVEIIGDAQGNVKAIKLVKNELYKSEDGSIRPRATEEYEEIPVGLVFRSIGYHGVPLPGVPFHEKWGVIHNDKGRITDLETEEHIPGLYTTGWIKRGPSGVIGTNKQDSGETVNCIVEDIENGSINLPENPDPQSVTELLRERKPDFVTYEDWLRLNELEIERGKALGKPRQKYTTIDEIMNALKENGDQ